MKAVRNLLCLAVVCGVCGISCSKKPAGPTGLEADLTRPAEEWLREEPVRLLRDYIRLETTDTRGEEEGARFLKGVLDCAGVESEIVCPAPTRCNLLARLPGRRHDRALLLVHHIDVAEVYAPFWKEAPPFEGTIKNGFLYGRGAYDDKSLGLAQVLALVRLRQRGIVPERDILLLAEADEEAGQRWGAAWLLEHRPDWFRTVGYVLNEGGNNELLLRDIRFWGLETLQAGYGLVEFEAASPQPLKDLAARWPRLNAPAVAPDPQVVRSFDMLANHLGHPLTDPLRHLDRVRTNPAELAILPDRYGAFLEPRIHFSEPYAVPPGQDRIYRAVAVVSAPPGVSPDPFIAGVEKDARAGSVRVVETLSSGVTSASPYPTPFTELLERVTAAMFPGVPFGPIPTFGGMTTSVYFRRRGIPSYGYSSIPMNITDSARRHGSDERLFLRDFLRGAALYAEVVEEIAFQP